MTLNRYVLVENPISVENGPFPFCISSKMVDFGRSKIDVKYVNFEIWELYCIILSFIQLSIFDRKRTFLSQNHLFKLITDRSTDITLVSKIVWAHFSHQFVINLSDFWPIIPPRWLWDRAIWHIGDLVYGRITTIWSRCVPHWVTWYVWSHDDYPKASDFLYYPLMSQNKAIEIQSKTDISPVYPFLTTEKHFWGLLNLGFWSSVTG